MRIKSWLPPFEQRALVLSTLLAAALGFAPQLAGPGYDSALIAGALGPGWCGVVASWSVLQSEEPSGRTAYGRGVRIGLCSWATAFLVCLLHGLRVGMCDPVEGLWLWLLGPGFGSVLGGVSGALAGLWIRAHASSWSVRWSRSIGAGLGLAGPLLGISVSLLRFYTSPMVFAYDPYFGYFSGPLYDTVIGSLWPLVTYRAGTLASLLVLALATSLVTWPANGAPRWNKPSGLQVLGLVLFTLLSVGISAAGTRLGHASTARSIQQELGRESQFGRCRIVHSRGVTERDAQRLGRECHAHLRQIERFFGAAGPATVTVYLFANDQEKGRLMGAAHTYIAKPWRHEVYVQAAGFPHPVLGHELAHVVSGSFGQGPFEVAGKLGGLWPDPGRIEGVATAASPDENDALTLEEWAAAMQRLELLPPLGSLFQFGFFGRNAAQAYTVSGAFVRFLRASYGASAVRRWYGGEGLPSITGKSLADLEQRWRAELRELTLSDAALAAARARFQRPSFFDRACPRVIDRELGEAQGQLVLADFGGARRGFEGVLRLDPHDSAARLGLAACSARSGQIEAAARSYRALQRATDAAPWARLQALEAEADLALRRGNLDEARALYAELAQRIVDEDRLRSLDVKRLAEPGLAQRAIVALLIGDELGPAWDSAAPLLGEWSASNASDGLADYLLAKNLFGRNRARDAQRYIERALTRALPEPRVHDEALRLQLLVGCASNDPERARPAYTSLLARPITRAKRVALERIAERCGIESAPNPVAP
ncbi:MAG TPA: tetratricopeptide repeat protein [Polyangiaceae bacterium]|nr:tetratricopeptide repeat protein [Polyangiaceae bacterium]